MSIREVSAFLAVAIVVLVAFGGCGGSDDEPSSSSSVTVLPSSLSKDEYANRVNQICGRGTSKVESLVTKAIVTGSGVHRVEAVFLPVVEKWVEEIKALGAPKGEEAQVEAFLTALKQDVEEAQAEPAKHIGALAKTFKESGDLAREDGIETCALG